MSIQNIKFSESERIYQDWSTIPDITQLEIGQKTPENPYPYQQGKFYGLVEVPIAPLDINFDIRYALWPQKERPDCYGIHFENFNNRVWQTNKVQAALADLSTSMKLWGNLTWIPFWSLDRLLGLFVQAKFYQPEAIVGHAMPKPEQIRYITRPENVKELRFYISADALLIKRFPQYGYLWNLFFWQLYKIPQILARVLRNRVSM